MPKFDFETTINAKEALKHLGMEEAFIAAELAGFSSITAEEEALLITDVLHKATITVDEEGTEAGVAATAVIVDLQVHAGTYSLKNRSPLSVFHSTSTYWIDPFYG